MFKFLLTVLGLFIASIVACAQSECVKGDCQEGYGIYVFENGDRFEGDYKNGQRIRGRYVWHDGSYYDGEWKDGKSNGEGRQVFADGTRFEGSFANDKFHGKGVLTQDDGTVIVGTWNMGVLTGTAIVNYASGDRYIGEFVDNKRNGPGITYYLKGGELRGEWRNDEYVSGSAKNYRYQGTVDLIERDGVYVVEVMINDRVRLPFVFDTGASIMLVTPDVLLTLVRGGTVSESDILEGAHFVDANGDVNKFVRFRIRNIKIGSHELTNVEAAVGNSMDASSLLGLSVIRKLGKVELDFMNNTLYSQPR